MHLNGGTLKCIDALINIKYFTLHIVDSIIFFIFASNLKFTDMKKINIKKTSYLGFIYVNGECFRLPNGLHYYIGANVCDVQKHLKANIYKCFHPSFVYENNFQFLIKNLMTGKQEFIETELPF